MKQPTSMEIFKALTPRQKCAIANAVHANDMTVPDPRHHRVNGNIRSILTFEVNELASLKGHGDDERDRSVDGYFGIWHGRVTVGDHRHAPKPLEDWDTIETAMAEGVITRLLARAGYDEDAEVHPGSDGKSIHVYKWSTIAELGIAGDRLSKSFSELMARPN